MQTIPVPSILTEEETARLDSALKGLGVIGVMCLGKRATCQRKVEAIVREACARMMDRLSDADPMGGAVWGICRLGAERLRGIDKLAKKSKKPI